MVVYARNNKTSFDPQSSKKRKKQQDDKEDAKITEIVEEIVDSTKDGKNDITLQYKML